MPLPYAWDHSYSSYVNKNDGEFNRPIRPKIRPSKHGPKGQLRRTQIIGLTLLLLDSSQGSLLPLLDHRPGNWLSDPWQDPFRVLEHDPYGIERDQQRSFSALPARVDWKETQDGHQIMIEFPGLKEDVKIEVDEKNRVLRVSGERKVEKEKEEDHWHHVERISGKFWRKFRLPDNVELENVAAKLEHGVLTLKMSKLVPKKIKGPRVVSIAGVEEEPQNLKSEL